MDEVGTSDVRKLPSSGRISLSEIKGEFKKGNNLADYYGVASGIPSSGTIKLTDFYGKEDGGPPTGTAPYGYYDASVSGVYESHRDWSGSQTLWLWLCDSNNHGGDFAPMLNEAGASTITNKGETDYDNLSRTHYPVLFGMSADGGKLDYYNGYNYLTVETAQGSRSHAGSWSAYTSPFRFFEFSNASAGADIAKALSTGSACWFRLSLNN